MIIKGSQCIKLATPQQEEELLNKEGYFVSAIYQLGGEFNVSNGDYALRLKDDIIRIYRKRERVNNE